MSQTTGGAKRPATPSERSAASRARRIEREQGRQVGVILPPEAAAALDSLQAGGYASEYASSATGCIALALIEAAARR